MSRQQQQQTPQGDDGSSDSDDDNLLCPICVEPFDESDRLFLPCHCNYRVCMFCVRRLMTEFDGRCPGCRAVYNESNFRVREVDPEEVARRKAKEKAKQQERASRQAKPVQPASTRPQDQNAKSRATTAASASSAATTTAAAAGVGAKTTAPAKPGAPQQQPQQSQSQQQPQQHQQHHGHSQAAQQQQQQQQQAHPTSQPAQTPYETQTPQEYLLSQQRKGLANVRVVQKHVVFVLGLSQTLAKEEILRRPEHFGQYGPITKIVVGHHPHASAATPASRQGSSSAQITFSRAADAEAAIRGVDGVVTNGHQIRASFGTTRYCPAFLRGQQCTNPDCLFLHKEVDENATTLQNAAPTSPPKTGTAALANVVGGGGGAGQQQSFGGTDPFALAVPPPPEPLNGTDLQQYGDRKSAQMSSRALGDGILVPAPANNSNNTRSSLASSAAHQDCPLSLLAELLSTRSVLPEDLKRKYSFVIGPRATSTGFSGLESILCGSGSLFIAPSAPAPAPAPAGSF